MLEDRELTKLRVRGVGGILVEDARLILRCVEDSYNSITLFEFATRKVKIFDEQAGSSQLSAIQGRVRPILERRMRDRFRVLGLGSFSNRPLSASDDATPTLAEIPLELSAVRFTSPGFWEFMGGMFPLETIRKYLNDRHERKRDSEWRDDAARRRAELENDILENDVMKGRIDMLKELGITDEEILVIVRQLVAAPLRNLGTLQDRNLLSTASLVKVSEIADAQYSGEAGFVQTEEDTF